MENEITQDTTVATAVVTTPVVATAVTDTTETVVTGTAADIAKIESAITELKTAGEDLFSDEITALEAKKTTLVAKLEAEVVTVETETETFWSKYKGAIGNAGIYILLIAIVYRLFFF